MRIEICGGIASGRTTLSNLIGAHGFHVVNEHFEAHPFLKKFYINPSNYSFETEMVFALQHYHDIKEIINKYKNIVCDNSLVLDAAFADVTLSPSENNCFSHLQKEILSQIGAPDLLIHLESTPEFLLKRIISRGREMEKDISLDYLSMLTNAIKKRLNTLKGPRIITLYPEQYDIYKEKDKNKLLKLIFESLNEV